MEIVNFNIELKVVTLGKNLGNTDFYGDDLRFSITVRVRRSLGDGKEIIGMHYCLQS